MKFFKGSVMGFAVCAMTVLAMPLMTALVPRQAGAEQMVEMLVLYTDKDFEGDKYVLEWDFDGPAKAQTTVYGFSDENRKFRKATSSFYVREGYKVTFFDRESLEGKSVTFKAGKYKYIGDEWNDRVRSFSFEYDYD
jgi:hypothetical protein